MKQIVSRMHVRTVTAAILLFVLLLLPIVSASAETGTIGVSPAYPQSDNDRSRGIFIHTTKPGETIEDGIKVQNNSNAAVTVVVDGVDSISSAGGSFACQQEAEKQKDVGTWFEFEKHEVEIEAKKSAVVDFSIKVPEKTNPGERNGCVVVREKTSDTPTEDGGVRISYRSAIRFSVTVPGKIVKQLDYKTIDITRADDGTYTVAPKAKNTGNVSLDVKTRVQLVDSFGNLTPLKDAQYPIMPGSTVGWNFEFKRPFWGGFYKALTSISYNANPKDGLGENVTDQKKIRKDTDYFFMIGAPEAIAIEAGVPLLMITFFIWKMRRRKQKKAVRTAWEQYMVVNGDSIIGLANSRAVSWKKIAKVNKLKEPYILQPGQVVLVPPMPKNDDWIVATEVAPAVQPAGPVPVTNPLEGAASIQKPVERPVEVSQGHIAPVKPVHSPPTSWVSPRESSRIELDEPAADWREGANDEELSKLEGIDGLTAVPKIKSPWDSDEAEKPKRAKRAKIKTKKPRAKKAK